MSQKNASSPMLEHGENEPWWAGWWLIPLILILIFVAWKLKPIILAGEGKEMKL